MSNHTIKPTKEEITAAIKKRLELGPISAMPSRYDIEPNIGPYEWAIREGLIAISAGGT